MAKATGAEVKGIDELKKKLGKLSEAAAGDVLKVALTAGALPIQNLSKVYAPYLSGALRSSIHTEANTVGAYKAEARIGTNVEYARAQEFGYKNIPPHPYMRPAFDEKLGEAQEEVAAVMREQIEKAA